MLTIIGLFLLSYFIGAFPQVYLLGRLKGVDLRKTHDLHIALYRQVSRPLALLGIVTDVAKGPAAFFLAYSLDTPLWAMVVCGLLALIGQMWPIFLGTGGRGNSTGLGLSFALSYSIALWGLIPLVLGLIIRTISRWWKRKGIVDTTPWPGMAVMMLIYFALLPSLSFYWQEKLPLSLAFLGIFLLIVLRRLTVGLGADLKTLHLQRPLWRILLNRFLYDHS